MIITVSVSDTFVVMTDPIRHNVPYHITNGTTESITVHWDSIQKIPEKNKNNNTLY